MSSELKPCPSCGLSDCLIDHNFDESSVRCQGCGMEGPIGDYGQCQRAWNSLPRKIKLTKDLPSEAGHYYRLGVAEDFGTLEVVQVFDDGYCSDGYENFSVSTIGGYWAKVDQSMFEVCDG